MDDPTAPAIETPSPPTPRSSNRLIRLYDRLDGLRKSQGARTLMVSALVAAYLGSLLTVELKRLGLLPQGVAEKVGSSHFVAIGIAFYLLVLSEIMGLIFSLADSVSRSVGKQIEILSLILLRQSFETLAGFAEPIRWDVILGRVSDSRLLDLILDALASLLVFVLVGYYYRILDQQPMSQDARDQGGFIAAKKMVALLLMVGLVIVTARGALDYFEVGGASSLFFEELFELLIFSDVLIVLISLRYSATYRVVFRNSAFALATVLIRLALAAPPPFGAILGVSAALYVVALTLAYNKYAPVLREVKPSQPGGED